MDFTDLAMISPILRGRTRLVTQKYIDDCYDDWHNQISV